VSANIGNFHPQPCRGHDEDGSRMKQLNVWPMLLLLIAVIFIIIWLRPQ
jgi:hypothetical protein